MSRKKEIHKLKIDSYSIIVYFNQASFYRSLSPDLKAQLKYMYGQKWGKPVDMVDASHNQGLADLDTKEIKLCIYRYSGSDAIAELVAHELGHLIKEKHIQNPPYNKKNIPEHEKKANHYENFYKLVTKISGAVYYCTWS